MRTLLVGLVGTLLAGSSLAQPAPNPPQGPAETNVRAAIARVEKLNPIVNAVLAIDPTAIDQARRLDLLRRARGPLYGMPVLIKDNIDMAGPLPTTAGSLALAANVTNRDAPLLKGVRASGAIIIGKTNLSEWANMRGRPSISGWSGAGGQVRNPHALNRTPCGSSSGSGAAVAAGMVDAAIGTETDGSVTCPAAINGIVGLKPTVGLVSRTHVIPISESQDTAGPMTRDVRTAALLLNAMAGGDPADAATAEADAHRSDYTAALKPDALKGVRIGVMRWAAGWSAPVDALFEAALATLTAQGAELVDVAAPTGTEGVSAGEYKVLVTELKAGLNAYLATTPAAVKTRTLADIIAFNKASPRELALFGQEHFIVAEATKGLADSEYKTARAVSLKQSTDALAGMIAAGKVAALVSPTAAPAWFIDAMVGDRSSGGRNAGSFAAVAGWPHLTVPMGAVKGLPVGLSFIGPRWSEAQLLAFGHAYEQASQKRVTPTFAVSVEALPALAPAFAPPVK